MNEIRDLPQGVKFVKVKNANAWIGDNGHVYRYTHKYGYIIRAYTYVDGHSPKLEINGRKYNLARLVYRVFSGRKPTKKEVIMFKDGNPNNCAFNNLYKVTVSKAYELQPRKGQLFLRNTKTGEVFTTLKSVAKKEGIGTNTLYSALFNPNWRTVRYKDLRGKYEVIKKVGYEDE